MGGDLVLIGFIMTGLGWWGVGTSDVFSVLGGGCLVQVGGRSGGLLLLRRRRVLSGKLSCGEFESVVEFVDGDEGSETFACFCGGGLEFF